MQNEDSFEEFTVLYADNVPVLAALTISLLPRDWCKLAKQPFFLELLEYLTALQIQDSKETLDMVRDLSETWGY